VPTTKTKPKKSRKELLGQFSTANSSLFSDYSLRPYNPDNLTRLKGGLDIYTEMRRDDQIKAALGIKKHSILGSGWVIHTDDPKINEHAEFVERNLTEDLEISFDEALYDILTALEYGFSCTEKILKVVDQQYKFSNFKTRAPHTFTFYTDDYGNIKEDGLRQDTQGGEIKLDRSKFILFVNQKEHDNWYGESELRACYRAWWSKNTIIKFWNMFLERFGMPTTIGKYDPNTTNTDLVTRFTTVLKDIQQKTTITIPEGFDVSFLEAMRRGPADYKEAISTYNLMIARSLLVPDLLGFSKEAEGGSYSLGQKHFDIFMISVERVRRQIELLIKQELIKYIIQLNFGEQEKYPDFKFKPLTERNKEELAKVWLDAAKFGVLQPTPKELSYFREVTGFPEPKEEKQPAGKAKAPTGETPKSEDEEKKFEFKLSRPLTVYEKKVNFKKVEEVLTNQSIEATVSIGAVLSGLVENLKDEIIEREIIPKKKLEALDKLSLKNLNQLKTSVKRHMLEFFKQGKAEGNEEISHVKKLKINPGALDPEKMKVFFDEKSFYVVNTLRDEINKIVKAHCFEGIKAGESTKDIIKAVSEDIAKYIPDREYIRNRRAAITEPKVARTVNQGARLEAIVRTNMMEAYNEGRMQFFQEEDVRDMIEAWQFSAIMDDRTSAICASLDQTVFGPNDYFNYQPPLHMNCRSMLIPITKFEDYKVTPADDIPGITGHGTTRKLI